MEFNDIYVNSVLGEIKTLVFSIINNESNYNSININEAEVRADSKMLDVLREILTGGSLDAKDLKYNFSLLSSVTSKTEEEFKIEFKHCLMFYYTALYFDKIDLLQDLFRRNLCKMGMEYTPNIYLLDSDFIDVFSDDYIEIIERAEPVLGYFYNSIKDVSGEERKEYFNKVARILLARRDLTVYCEEMLEKERLDFIEELKQVRVS